MARSFSPIIALMFLQAGLLCCSGPEVRTESAPDLDLSKYHSYSWAPEKQLEQPLEFSEHRNDILDQQIKRSVDSTLEKRGLQAKREHGDLNVVYSVRTQKTVEVQPGFYPEPYYAYWNEIPANRVIQGRKASVDVDLIDARTGKLVWRGVAVSDIDETGPKPQQIEQALNDILQHLSPETKTG